MPFASAVDSLAQSAQSDKHLVFRGVRSVYFDSDGRESLDLQALMATPVFLGHSEDDETVLVVSGKRMYDILRHRLGLSVDYHEYPTGGHWVNEPQGVDDLVEFLRENMVRLESEMTPRASRDA
jgi:lysophospholipase II